MKVFGGRAGGIARWLAEHEGWLVCLVVPVLVIAPSPLLPSWLVAAAMLAVPIPFAARQAAYGRLSVRTPQEEPLLLLLAMHAVALLVTTDMSLTMLVLKRTALAIIIFFFLVNAIDRQAQVVWAAAVLVGAGVLMGGLGLVGANWNVDKLLPLQALSARLPHTVFAGLNAAGFSLNIVGGAVAMIVPLSLTLLACQRGLARLLCLAVCAALLGAVLLSQSRGALLGLMVAMWLMAVSVDRRAFWLLPLAALALALAWLRYGLPALGEMLLVTQALDGAFASRLELWQRALYMIQDFPFTGIGAGTFSRVLPALYPVFLASPNTVVPHAHLMYLQAAVDFGLPGAVAFAALLTSLLLVGITGIRQADGTARWLALGLFGGFVVYLVHGLVDDVTFSAKAAAVLWTIAGLMVAQWRLVQHADSQVAPLSDAPCVGRQSKEGGGKAR